MSAAVAERQLTYADIRAAIEAYPEEWIRAAVRIENPDTGAPQRFDLWPAQQEVLEAMRRERLLVILKARQLGLTWLALVYALWRMYTVPGYRVTVLSKGQEEARELIRRARFVLTHLPSWCVVHGRTRGEIPGWDGTSERVTLEHPGGQVSIMQAFAASPDAGRAFTSSLVIIDEWAFQQYAEEIWSAAYPTINRPGGGQVIGISTGRIGTLFERIWHDAQAGRNTFRPIFLPWHADPRRDEEWYERTKRDLPQTYRAEYPSVPEEAFTVGEGAAFQEWNPLIHAPYGPDWYPPPTWKIVRAYDGGYVQAACKWYAISPDGVAVAYREFYPQRMTDDEQAREIVRLSRDPNGVPESIAYTVADPAVWSKQSGKGESTAEVFARHGIPLIRADNDRINGWKRLHQWLRPYPGPDGRLTARLLHTQACRNSLRVYPAIPVDKHRPDDIDTDAEDHLLDCDRYFVMSRPSPAVDEHERRRRVRQRARATRPVVSSITGY